MRIACASDAHGATRKIDRLVENMPPIDSFIFLGDCDRDAVYISYALSEIQPQVSFHAVCGNNDPFSKLPGTLLLWLGNTRAFITHGHLFQVKTSLQRLQAETTRHDCSLALFGHTHHPLITQTETCLFVNPGALQNGEWAFLDIGEEVHAALQVL